MRVHYHTDCFTFSGSEVTLVALLAEAFRDADQEAIFTYRRSAEYEAGLRSVLDPGVVARPLSLPDPEDLKRLVSGRMPAQVATVIRGMITLLPCRPACLLWSTARMYAEIRRTHPDVVHVNNGGHPGAVSCNAAVLAAAAAGIPAVYVVNNIAYSYRMPWRWLDYPFDRLIARNAAVFVTGSRTAAAALQRVLRTASNRHMVIPNTVTVRSPTKDPAEMRDELGIGSSLIILCVARLEHRKGHHVLFDAVSRLPEAAKESLTLVLAGDGPERARLENRVAALGLGKTVRFLGHYPDQWSLYAAADIVVLASTDHEDFPVVLLEAMSAGNPIVATAVSGIPDQVLDGETGLVVAPGDSRALAEALHKLITAPALRSTMGAAGRARFGRLFTVSQAVRSYREAHRAALASRRRSTTPVEDGA